MEVEGPRFIEIHNAFAATELGQQIAGKVRYEKYKPASVSNERWVELLGADVNALTHGPLTYGLTKSFIRHTQQEQPQLFNAHEVDVLKVTAISHDWGESVGRDISYSDVTAADKAAERQDFIENLERFYPQGTNEAKELLQEALGSVIFDSSTKLGEMFNAVERVGYVRTALRAARHLNQDTAPECAAAFRWIIADVFGNQIAKLTEYAGKYAAVQKYLRSTILDVMLAFEFVQPQDFLNYEPQRQAEKSEVFGAAYSAWSQWLLHTLAPGESGN